MNHPKTVPGPDPRAGQAEAWPEVVDRASWQREVEALRAREKEHLRAGDALAAARRRLPMVEVDPTTPLEGAAGPVTLLEAFEGRTHLLAYLHMWHAGSPAEQQCPGCTFYASQVTELAYLHSRDVTFAVLAQGPLDEALRYRDFMGYDVPWYALRESQATLTEGRTEYPFHLNAYDRRGGQVFETYTTTGRGVEAMSTSYSLLDLTLHGRQEIWEDSPSGWPQLWTSDGGQQRVDGRPSAQWSRLVAGRGDDLGPGRDGEPGHCCGP